MKGNENKRPFITEIFVVKAVKYSTYNSNLKQTHPQQYKYYVSLYKRSWTRLLYQEGFCLEAHHLPLKPYCLFLLWSNFHFILSNVTIHHSSVILWASTLGKCNNITPPPGFKLNKPQLKIAADWNSGGIQSSLLPSHHSDLIWPGSENITNLPTVSLCRHYSPKKKRHFFPVHPPRQAESWQDCMNAF